MKNQIHYFLWFCNTACKYCNLQVTREDEITQKNVDLWASAMEAGSLAEDPTPWFGCVGWLAHDSMPPCTGGMSGLLVSWSPAFHNRGATGLLHMAPAGLLNKERKGKGKKGRREGARGQFAVSEIGKLKSIVGQHGLPGDQCCSRSP